MSSDPLKTLPLLVLSRGSAVEQCAGTLLERRSESQAKPSAACSTVTAPGRGCSTVPETRCGTVERHADRHDKTECPSKPSHSTRIRPSRTRIGMS
jgi:hypothetical protein